MSARLFDLLRHEIHDRLVLLDVGGMGGVIDSWRSFGDKAHIFCFEARDEEAEDLISRNDQAEIEYVPLALASDDRGIELTVTRNPGSSSIYTPRPAICERYPGCADMRPARKVACPSTTMDAFIRSRGIDRVHGIKLDTQGSELDILRGAEEALKRCLFLIVEVEFNALYEGQPLFCDLDRFLRDRGFVLWRLENLAHYSTELMDGPQHPIRVGSEPGGQQSVSFPAGQLFWSDAFYVREEATAVSQASLSRQDAVAGAALVSQWNFSDLALEMLRKSGDQTLIDRAALALNHIFVPAVEPFITAARFGSQVIGDRDKPSWLLDFEARNACLVFGPYVRLPQGQVEISFDVELVDAADETLRHPIIFDVAQDTLPQEVVRLEGKAGMDALRSGAITLRVANNSPHSNFEFRIYSTEKPFSGALEFKGVRLRQLPDN